MFCTRKPRSFPVYKAWVRFSVDITRAKLLGCDDNTELASSREMTPALHPCTMEVSMRRLPPLKVYKYKQVRSDQSLVTMPERL